MPDYGELIGDDEGAVRTLSRAGRERALDR
jgi:hypothetical protein